MATKSGAGDAEKSPGRRRGAKGSGGRKGASKKSASRKSPSRRGGGAATPARRRRRGKDQPPPVFAAIDIGATSIRMEVAQAEEDESFVSLDHVVHPVQIGQDTFRYGYVRPESFRSICQVLQNFTEVMKTYGAEECRAVATSAIRDATNQAVLVDRIRHASGIAPEVLDAVSETRLTYQTLLPFLRHHAETPDTYSMLLDLGGGSTEFMVLRGENLVFAGSRRLGTSRIFQSLQRTVAADRQVMLETVIRNVVNSALELCRAYPITQVIVINAVLLKTIRSLEESETLEGGVAASAPLVSRTLERMEALETGDAADRYGLSLSEAETLLPALMILKRFLKGVRAEKVLLAEVDLLQGVLMDMRMEMAGEDPFERFQEQIVRSAIAVAEKYHYDAGHSLQVAQLSVQIYDGVRGLLDLGGKDRLYLHVAAILHDTGMFVSERAHHKHSAYLIEWAEILGLSEHERRIVALVARYHRKAMPRQQHIEYSSLTEPDQLRVSKLAAILRLGDALDRSHRQHIRAVTAEPEETRLTLLADTPADLTVETAALREKGNLFEEITGLDVRLRRAPS